jgi:UDP-N-acetylglucosamine 4-epimerase
VVDINILSLTTTNTEAFGKIYNVACGNSTTLTEIWESIKNISNSDANAIYAEPREGDILQSLADISLARKYLDYDPKVAVKEGLAKSLEWYTTVI